MKRPKLWLWLLTTAFLAAGPIVSAPNAPEALPLRMLEGETTSLGHCRGKVLVLSFWTVDCRPCKAEMVQLDILQKDLKARGLEVIAVNLDEARTRSRIKPTIRRYGYSFSVALDPEGETAAPFNPNRMTPYTVVIDRNGQVGDTHIGYRAGDEIELRQKVEAALAEGGEG